MRVNLQVPLLRYGIGPVLGSLLPLAFAPFGLWPLAIVLPAAMIYLLRDSDSIKSTLLAGWLFGCGYFGFGVYWIYNSLHDFGMAPPVVASTITGLMVVVLALFPALAFASWHAARRPYPRTALWALPLYWFGMEWLRGWIFTGMPWLSLGYSQTDSPLMGFAPLIGVFGVSALCLLMAVALYRLLCDQQYRMLLPLVLIPLAGWLLQPLDWTSQQEKGLDVALVQGNIPQEVKWRGDQQQNIFNTYWRETARHWGRDLIVWPETALPGHSQAIETTLLQPLERTAKASGSVLLSGLVVSDRQSDQYFNSVIQLGEERGFYHKRHLVLFGEYYPMRWLLDLLSGMISIPYSDLTAGPLEQPAMRVGDSILGVSICFEDVFSREILLALPEANLLVNVTNDAWFGDSTAPHQHLQIARMRARETGRPMLRAANTGVSAFIDHRGAVTVQTRQFVTESISARVYGRSGSTPFYYFAAIQWLLALAPFLWLFARLYREASKAG